MGLIVYADFSCPNCYLASRRADMLIAAGVTVDWRAVERLPRPLVPGIRLVGAARDALASEMAVVTGLLLPGESLPWEIPAITPRTQAAVSAYAEAHGAGVADDVRRVLFSLYWMDGADIGNPNVLRAPLLGPILRGHSDALPLRESGLAVSVDGGPITTEAYRRIRDWQAEWERLGAADLPVVVADGQTIAGTAAVRRLGEQVTASRAATAPVFPDPTRYPRTVVHPDAGWVSETGATWIHACRNDGLTATGHLR